MIRFNRQSEKGTVSVRDLHNLLCHLLLQKKNRVFKGKVMKTKETLVIKKVKIDRHSRTGTKITSGLACHIQIKLQVANEKRSIDFT